MINEKLLETNQDQESRLDHLVESRLDNSLSDLVVEVAPHQFKEDNPSLGIIYFLLSGVAMCLNFTTAKVLYTSHPEMTTP